MKKFLSVILAVAIIICAVPIGTFTFTARALKDGYYEYEIENGEVTIKNVDVKISGDVTIPSKINGYPVKYIYWCAFDSCRNITSITIPDSIVSIGGRAFSKCAAIKTINMSDNVKEIGVGAFDDTAYYCDESNWQDGVLYIGNHLIRAKNTISGEYTIKEGTITIAAWAFIVCKDLTDITIPESVINIGQSSFENCDGLTKVTIPNSVTDIYSCAFRECDNLQNITLSDNLIGISNQMFSGCVDLTSITIPKCVAKVGDKAFANCENLSEIIVDENNTNLCSDNNVLFNKDKTELILYPSGKVEKEYVIPDSVVSLNNYAFYGCKNLGTITISKNVAKIGDRLFENCSNLTCLNYNAINCLSRGNEIYTGTAITVLNIGDDVEVIPKSIFSGVYNIESVTIPNSVKTIDDSAFSGCRNLSSVTIPDGVTKIGNYAFSGCTSLSDITISDTVESIGYSAFASTACISDESNWVNNVFYIDNHLIKSNSKISGEYQIKNGTKTIASYAFSGCDNLESVVIPNSVAGIGDHSLDCKKLSNIEVSSNNERYSSIDGVLFDKNATKLIRYPVGKTDSAYVVPDTVKTVCAFAFDSCKSLTTVMFSNGVTNIGNYAFIRCENLLCVFLPETIIDINENAFDYSNSFVICGCEDTYVEQYAKDNKIEFYIVFDSVDQNGNNFWENVTVDIDGSYEAYVVMGTITNNEISENNTPIFAIYDEKGNEVQLNPRTGKYVLFKEKNYTIVAHNYILAYQLKRTSGSMFPDVSISAWYTDAVKYVVGSGIMGGYSNGLFGTSDSIQRQDFLVMLARLDGVNLDNYKYKSSFPDVARNSYYEAAVNWGAKNGIVTGYDSGKFGVGDKVTREQLVTFLYRYAKYKGYDYSYTTDRETTVSGQYIDYKNVSGFAKDSILWAIEKGVISGKTSSTIVPQGNAQRCEVAKIMYNIYVNDIFK